MGRPEQQQGKLRNGRLDGHTALVTGASRGLGAAIALELGRLGAAVVANYFANRQRAEELCAAIEKAGGSAIAVHADVRREDDVAAMFRTLQSQGLGPVDLCVFNATGPQPLMPIEEQSWETHLQQIEFFVKSPVIILKHLIEPMKKQRFGRIVHIGSEVADIGNARFAHYVAAKSAQLGLTRSWARELAPFGITVNLVAPGWIPTERHVDATAEEMAAYAENVPLKHMGSPEDVASIVAFLMSEGGRFITGQKISVNGGNTFA